MAAPAPDSAATQDAAVEAPKVPNSPSSAFAALSLDDTNQPPLASGSRSSPFTDVHLRELDASAALVHALDLARKAAKPLIRSTGHLSQGHHLLSWKVSEFAYRKSTSVGSELPTLARGLFTERIDTVASDHDHGEAKHRIVVRGYDKFFNLGEMPWTKPTSIDAYTTPPYVLTFKENGCIIFIAALSPSELVVSSKHALASTHAEKGYEWLLKHLHSVGRTEQQLAAELWNRNETAAFELCDDSFEEHVLAYSEARSGLHLHGLNSNSVQFSTRPMQDVDEFANTWGFIPTRWLTLQTLDEVKRMTAQIEATGMWEGEAIEGFVIRTHTPDEAQLERLRNQQQDVVAPPYHAGQAWFYKVKFDEPYLMYRDWRELARKMVKEKQEWEAKLSAQQASSSSSSSSCAISADSPTALTLATPDEVEPDAALGSEDKSKAALKRERKRLAKQAAKQSSLALSAARTAGLVPPPQPRSKRAETLQFIQWAYDRLYGNPSLKIEPQPALFAPLAHNKGIIAMRQAFLAHLASTAHSPNAQNQQPHATAEDKRQYTKTILAPVAVPGCGKTVLALALRELFGVGLVQSDDFKAKKGFLGALERDLRAHAAESNYVVFADKNNHLFSHRDELIDLARGLSQPQPQVQQQSNSGKKSKKPAMEVGRIRTVALVWDLDGLALNTLHRVCAERIEKRGENHQTLVAEVDEARIRGVRSHEVVLWRFLEALQPFGSSEGKGEGDQGYGDGGFDRVVRLSVRASARENLMTVVKALGEVVGWKMPSEERVHEAFEKAGSWKVHKRASADKAKEKREEEGRDGVRYFGLAVELDVRSTLDSLLLDPAVSVDSDISSFYTHLKFNSRLNQRPHITLVHHSSLSSSTPPPSTTTSDPNLADKKWHFYTSFLQSPRNTSEGKDDDEIFTITLSTLLYQKDTLLTFAIDSIVPPTHFTSQFNNLHQNQQDWSPHITIGTKDNEIKPYKANHVVSRFRNNQIHPEDNIHILKLNNPLTVHARVFAMS